MEKDKEINELELLISEAYKNSNPTLLHYVVNIVYSKIDLRHSYLKKIDIEKLNKVAIKAEKIDSLFCVGLIYNIIFSYKLIEIEVLSPESILTIVNILLPIYEIINGTILATRIGGRIKLLLHLLLNRPDIAEDEKITINALLNSPQLKKEKLTEEFDELPEIKAVKNLAKSKDQLSKISSLLKFMDFISNCSGLEEQLDLFPKKAQIIFKLIVGDNTEKTRDLLLTLGVYLDFMLFQTEFLIKIKKEVFDADLLDEQKKSFMNFETEPGKKKSMDANDIINSINEELKERVSNDLILSYKIVEQERLLKQYESIYSTVAFIINTFLLFPKIIEVQKLSLVVLQRLYYLFPKFRKHLEEPILTIFSYIHDDNYEINKKEASIFLYKLIHRDASPEFKANIESKENFRTLYTTGYYHPSVLIIEKNEYEAHELQDLNPKAGFPLNITIGAGEKFSQVIEIWKPYSIIFWSLSPQQYDINVSLSRIACFNNIANNKEDKEVLYFENRKVEASRIPGKGYLIVTEPGLYKFEFDNTFSWFNSKIIKYRLLVFEPDFNVENVIGKSLMKNIMLPSRVFDPNGVPVEVETTSSTLSSTTITESNLINAYSKDNVTFNDIKCFAYFKINLVEFSISTIDKSYEIVIHFEDGKINWNNVNERINEIVAKMIASIKGSQKLDVRIIFNEKVYEKIIAGTKIQFKDYEEYFPKNLTFLSKYQKYMAGPLKISPEIGFLFDKLANDKLFEKISLIYIICIQYETQKISGKMAKDVNNKFSKIEIDDICVPVLQDDQLILKNISNAYFEQQQEKDKMIILASVVANLYLMLDRQCYQFALFETEPSIIASQDKAKEFDNLVEEYLIKIGKSRFQESREQKSLSITVAKINISEYIKLSS